MAASRTSWPGPCCVVLLHGLCWQSLMCACYVQAMSLALSCLSYDFIGTCLDESSEDLATIQVHHTRPPG